MQMSKCHLHKCQTSLGQVQKLVTHPSNIPDWEWSLLKIHRACNYTNYLIKSKGSLRELRSLLSQDILLNLSWTFPCHLLWIIRLRRWDDALILLQLCSLLSLRLKRHSWINIHFHKFSISDGGNCKRWPKGCSFQYTRRNSSSRCILSCQSAFCQYSCQWAE